MDNSSEEAIDALQAMGTIISSCMVGILSFMVCLGLSALVYRQALGSQKELRVFNLGKVPEESRVFGALMDISKFIKEDGADKDQKFIKDLGALSVYDLTAVTRALDILADDLEMAVGAQSMRSSSSARRIASGKRTSKNHSRDSGMRDSVGSARESVTETNAAACLLVRQSVRIFMVNSL